jgi:hypothetical protein
VVRSFHESWREIGSERDVAEGKALWYSFHLVFDCQAAFAGKYEQVTTPAMKLLQLQPDQQKRYDTHAALAAIVMFADLTDPYRPAIERIVRRPDHDDDLDAFFGSFVAREPDAMHEWRGWLRPESGAEGDYGPASTFEIAAKRLSRCLGDLHTLYPEDPDAQLPS